jgi:agmatine/peptidylarginine deiminase
MKIFTFSSIALFILITANSLAQQADPNNGLKHIMTPEEAALSDRIGLGFVETDPPVGIVRNVEEFGNNDGVLIRYPFGIPMTLITEMAKDAKVTTIVANVSEQNTVTNLYTTNGVNLANCSFLIAPTNSYWTRDYGPWYVTFGNNEVGIVDFPYNRPRPNDDEIPKKVATSQGIPWFGMNVIHTGGNYMTNGIDHSSSTTLVWDENPTQTSGQIDQKMHDYLGINYYMVQEDPNGTYIDHIDCWGKFLGPDKVLIRKVPSSHSQYTEIEATANFYATQISSYGTFYKVFRVNTPNNEPYTNSYILKDKVFVPIMGSINDAQAILAYKNAMPGYQVIGILGNPSTPWESTDALHCRTHEMADQGMLMISHTPLHDSIPAQPYFQVNADITAFSGLSIYPDSVWTIYKVNAGEWDTLTMTNTSGVDWTADIPGQMEGSEISYFIHAEDASNRSANHPYIGAPDPHRFYVKYSLDVSPDTLQFLTFDDIIYGKTTMIKNMLDQEVVINQINNSGENPFPWLIDPWNIVLPYTMQAGETLNLTVKLGNPLAISNDPLCDTLLVNTSFSNNQAFICVDPFLLTGIQLAQSSSEVSVYPNPMKSSTTFSINTKNASLVTIEIYSMHGSLVAVPYRQMLSTGQHTILWEGNGLRNEKLSPGIYLYRISVGDDISDGKISIVR